MIKVLVLLLAATVASAQEAAIYAYFASTNTMRVQYGTSKALVCNFVKTPGQTWTYCYVMGKLFVNMIVYGPYVDYIAAWDENDLYVSIRISIDEQGYDFTVNAEQNRPNPDRPYSFYHNKKKGDWPKR